VPLATLSRFGSGFGISAVENVPPPIFRRSQERPQGDVNGKALDGAAPFCFEIRLVA